MNESVNTLKKIYLIYCTMNEKKKIVPSMHLCIIQNKDINNVMYIVFIDH